MKKLRKVKKLKKWSRQTLWVVMNQQRKRREGNDFGGNTVWLINDDNLLIDGLQVVS